MRIHAKLSDGESTVAMRALIVEDEARVAENIAAALRESAGLAVDVAANGPTASSWGGRPITT